MSLTPFLFWAGVLFRAQTLQSSDQLVGIQWWMWLVILLTLLVILILGLISEEKRVLRYPGTPQVLPEIARDQMSTGTELESTLSAGTASSEDSRPKTS